MAACEFFHRNRMCCTSSSRCVIQRLVFDMRPIRRSAWHYAAEAQHHRPAQFGIPEQLDGGEEGIHVEMGDTAGRRHGGYGRMRFESLSDARRHLEAVAVSLFPRSTIGPLRAAEPGRGFPAPAGRSLESGGVERRPVKRGFRHLPALAHPGGHSHQLFKPFLYLIHESSLSVASGR